MMTFIKAIQTSDGKTFNSLEEAQARELGILLSSDNSLSNISVPQITAVCTSLVSISEKVIDILTTTPNSKPSARKVNGGTKKRKPAPVQVPPALIPA